MWLRYKHSRRTSASALISANSSHVSALINADRSFIQHLQKSYTFLFLENVMPVSATQSGGADDYAAAAAVA